MKNLLSILSILSLPLCTAAPLPAAAEESAHIVCLTVEDPSNYDAVNFCRGFAEREWHELGHRVTIIEGDHERPTHFEGFLEAMETADLLVVFVRRATPPREQLDAIRAHLAAGKPLLGIRTANHAFVPLPNQPVTDPTLDSWPAFVPEVLGCDNTGGEKKGLPYRVTRHPEAPADSPLLEGIDPAAILGHASLYRVLPLAPDATPLLLGQAQGIEPAQPLAWTRTYGPQKARVFYTSLGAPEDAVQPAVRRLFVNAVKWSLGDTHASALKEQTLWTSGKDGYHTYRIPALLTTPQGTVLAFCEGRKISRSDHGDIDLLVKRSEDGGRTWSAQAIVHEEGGEAAVTIGNPCPVVDEATGTIWLPFTRENRTVFVTSSRDEGRTWSPPVEISESTTRPDWDWVATGPGVGIQLSQGPHRGRLVIPCDHKRGLKSDTPELNSHMMFSDDGGETWQIGAPIQTVGNECQVVELEDGRLLVNIRMNGDFRGRRGTATSEDGGATWTAIAHDENLACPKCQASLLRLRDGSLLFANPDPGAKAGARIDLTLRLSTDEGSTWPVAKALRKGPSGYSSLAELADGTILCLYETGAKDYRETITLARLPREWLAAPSVAKAFPDPPFPRIFRTFMPESGPSAFAVELATGLGLCYDPLRGGINRAWRGSVDLAPTLRAKINEPAAIEGEVFYEESIQHPLRIGDPAAATEHRFKGYRYEGGAVVFEYTLRGHAVAETLRPIEDGSGLVREFAFPNGGGPAFLRIEKQPSAEVRVKGGEEIEPGLWRFPEGGRALVTLHALAAEVPAR